MLPLLTAGLALLQGKQKDAEARKQNAISAYMGESPTAKTSNTGDALMGALPGLLQGGAGTAAKAATSLGAPRYDDTTPAMGGGGMSQGSVNFLDDTFGAPGSFNPMSLVQGQHKEPDGDESYFQDGDLL